MVQSVAKNGRVVISIGIKPERLQTKDLSAPYSEIEIGYLVGQTSPIAAFPDVDGPGMRIAILERGGCALLTKALKHASLVRTQSIGNSVELVKTGKADATSALKTFLIPACERLRVDASSKAGRRCRKLRSVFPRDARSTRGLCGDSLTN